jgi:hypothetical protein
VLQEVLVARRQRRDAQVLDVVREMLVRVCGLTVLELSVAGQDLEPRLRRVAERADRRPRVGQQEPGALLVVRKHFADAVGPPRKELRREPRLERLDRTAGLEPDDLAGERHAQNCGPRLLVRLLDRPDRLDVRADPGLDVREVHVPTMPSPMPTYLVVRRQAGPRWDPSQPLEGQSDWPAHASFMDALVDSGFIVLGGPIADDNRVVFAIEAESEDAVRDTLARDPWSDTHLLLETVDRWIVRLDGRSRGT